MLQGVHRTWAPVADLVTELAAELGHPAQTNAYITPASSQGFSAHYDVHDVFVLQVAGTKRWHVHAPVHADPLRSQPWNDRADAVAARATEDPLIDEVLEPGDVLYLPRGYLHSATAQGEVSAHLTIGVHVLTRWAVVDALVNALTDDPALRGSLPLGIDAADPEALAPHVEAVAARLAETLAAPDPARAERVARRLRRRAWTGNRPEAVAPLAQAAASTAADASTAVRCRRGLHHRLRTERRRRRPARARRPHRDAARGHARGLRAPARRAPRHRRRAARCRPGRRRRGRPSAAARGRAAPGVTHTGCPPWPRPGMTER